MIPIFYQPENAWAADCIPFFHDGTYYLYYLLDWRDKEGHGEGTPWYLVTTRDMVHFTEYGEMLARGTADAQDLYVFTGSVVQGLGQFHIFYTGHNHHLSALGKPAQGIMHAVSDDLLHWRKLPADTFCAPEPLYERHDWRDPFVFWNDEAREYWMLLAARQPGGPSRRLCLPRRERRLCPRAHPRADAGRPRALVGALLRRLWPDGPRRGSAPRPAHHPPLGHALS